MVLVHDHGDVGVRLNRGQHQMAQISFTRIFTSTCRGLQDHGAVRLLCSLHDGLHLLEVVDVKSRYAIAMLGGMV